jgi:hypothetical protein
MLQACPVQILTGIPSILCQVSCDFSQFLLADATTTCKLFFIPSFTNHLIFDGVWSERLRVSWKSSISDKIFNKIYTLGPHLESHISSFLPHKCYLLHWALFNPFARKPGSLHSWKCVVKILVSFYFSCFILQLALLTYAKWSCQNNFDHSVAAPALLNESFIANKSIIYIPSWQFCSENWMSL